MAESTRNLIREVTAFLLDMLKPDLSEHGHLQTKVLEINLKTFPDVADAILAKGLFSHYDRPRIAKLCGKAGLFIRALGVLVFSFQQLALFDYGCPEDFINGLLLSVSSRFPVECVVEECVKRNHLRFLTRLLEDLVSEGSQDVDVHNAVVSAAVKAFMNANLTHEVIELLDKIVLQSSSFTGNFNLNGLLIIAAIKADPKRATGYINRLDNFDGLAVGKVAVEANLYEEAFAIFKKFNLNVQAVNVLLDNFQTIDRAMEFTFCVEEDSVWSQVAKAKLRKGLVGDAIELFIRVSDATHFLEVIKAAEGANVYHDLVKYLLMVRKKTKEPKVDSELIYAYAKIGQLGEIQKFILMPNVSNLPNVGDRLYAEALYEAAKIIFAFISDWAKLAVTLAKLQQFQDAVDAARKANSLKTWKEVCFACIDAGEFPLAQICGVNVLVQVDNLEELSMYYQNNGHFIQLISLMEIEAWDHMQFKDIIVKVSRVELYYEAVHFYFAEHHDVINDLLNVLARRVNHTRVVDIAQKVYISRGPHPLIKPYMVAVSSNVFSVNEALNEIYVEEEDYDRLRESIDLHDNFNHIGLAQKIEKHEQIETLRFLPPDSTGIKKFCPNWNQVQTVPSDRRTLCIKNFSPWLFRSFRSALRH
ncbi:hypothetical protein RYX36_006674 [Vicia faba]